MTLDEAIALARRFHEGQVDKAGRPYVGHPLRVMERVSGPDEKLAAVLHDLLEDTALTSADLQAAGCPPRVLAALDALTRRDGEPYEAFVARAAADPVARAVKLADIEDNLDPARLAALDPAQAHRLRAKYARAQEVVSATPAAAPPPEADPLGLFADEDAATGPFAMFDCAACGHPAGRVELGPEWALVTSHMGRSLTRIEHGHEALASAIAAGDAAALYGIDLAPFWCPHCPAPYCYRHWRTEVVFDEGFYDYTDGTCPEGHRTMVDD